MSPFKVGLAYELAWMAADPLFLFLKLDPATGVYLLVLQGLILYAMISGVVESFGVLNPRVLVALGEILLYLKLLTVALAV